MMMGIPFTDATLSDSGDWMLVRSVGAKNHYVHKCLFGKLVADLEMHGHHVDDSVPTMSMRYELPVSRFVDGRPEEHIKIDVLSITVPSRDVEPTMHQLMNLTNLRFVDGTPYFKVEGMMSCIVMTPEQWHAFGQALASLIDRAKQREDEFFRERGRDDTDSD